MTAVRCIVEVSAGIIPGTAEDGFTKQYVITSDDWEAAGAEQGLLLLETYAKAMAYSMSILDPARVNWTQVNWIWM